MTNPPRSGLVRLGQVRLGYLTGLMLVLLNTFFLSATMNKFYLKLKCSLLLDRVVTFTKQRIRTEVKRNNNNKTGGERINRINSKKVQRIRKIT